MRRALLIAALVALAVSTGQGNQALGRATFVWTVDAGDPATAARVERSGVLVECGPVTVLSTSGGTVDRTCQAVLASGPANFRVQAYVGGIESAWSGVTSATIPAGAPPGAADTIAAFVPPLVTAPAPFPSTPLLDAFNRATGPIGSAWRADQMGLGFDGHDVVNSRAATGVQTYIATSYSGTVEAYVTVAQLGGSIVGLHARIQQPGTASASAYEVSWTTSGRLKITRVRNAYSVEVDLAQATVAGLATGVKLGVRVRDDAATTVIEVFVDTGTGWRSVLTTTDTDATRITGAGYLGMVGSLPDQGLQFDDFGGGARPQ